ncbi:hypothetical protein EXIGLDRAFT_510671 [Exidia glandulosa HHB12029]|uniref:MYND-type domain-containing protein n=1 Tax=Exidia glandulosa HHB12029 TaxID=1314781 RepID=A0A165PDS0_EXIGL|nr:hypothetical protein EXIGLDRAFT_510671 [Exidia glandulosa HHB12029]
MQNPFPPAHRLDKCNGCGLKDGPLDPCSTCAHALYCSKECRRNDWPQHKPLCRKIHRIDMHTFHVFLACFGHHIRSEMAKENVAMNHVITRYQRPIATAPHLVHLSNTPCQPASKVDDVSPAWYPTASSTEARQYLWKRISSDCSAFGLHLAIAISLLAQLYPASDIGLWLNGAAVTDFGLAFGAAPALQQNQMTYTYNGGAISGQNPSRHAWLYFTNTSGETATLDLALFSLNCGLLVSTTGFCDGLDGIETPPRFVPAVWRPVDNKQFYVERARMSVLRNAPLVKVAAIVNSNVNAATNIRIARYHPGVAEEMFTHLKSGLTGVTIDERMAGERLRVVLVWATTCAFQLRDVVVRNKSWYRWPKDWTGAIDYDPEDAENDCAKIAKAFNSRQHAAR